MLWLFFEARNHRKGVIRLGEEDYGTFQTETLLNLNSFAKSVGFKEVPYKKVSAPTSNENITESFGFSYKLAGSVHLVSNPTYDTGTVQVFNSCDDDDAGGETDGDNAEASLLIDNNEMADVEVDIGDLQPPTECAQRQVERRLCFDEIATTAGDVDENNREFIQAELAKLLPTITRESTLDAFRRLTEEATWFPFRSPASTTPETAIDKEESALFDKLLGDNGFERLAKSGTKTFKRFEIAWNHEVAKRFKQWSEGDDEIIQVRRKTVVQLQQHYDKRTEYASLQATAPNSRE